MVAEPGKEGLEASRSVTTSGSPQQAHYGQRQPAIAQRKLDLLPTLPLEREDYSGVENSWEETEAGARPGPARRTGTGGKFAWDRSGSVAAGFLKNEEQQGLPRGAGRLATIADSIRRERSFMGDPWDDSYGVKAEEVRLMESWLDQMLAGGLKRPGKPKVGTTTGADDARLLSGSDKEELDGRRLEGGLKSTGLDRPSLAKVMTNPTAIDDLYRAMCIHVKGLHDFVTGLRATFSDEMWQTREEVVSKVMASFHLLVGQTLQMSAEKKGLGWGEEGEVKDEDWEKMFPIDNAVGDSRRALRSRGRWEVRALMAWKMLEKEKEQTQKDARAKEEMQKEIALLKMQVQELRGEKDKAVEGSKAAAAKLETLQKEREKEKEAEKKERERKAQDDKIRAKKNADEKTAAFSPEMDAQKQAGQHNTIKPPQCSTHCLFLTIV
ncbi:hypothetical protein CBR_g17027 [Chara braunii]|uniref:Uncharacterized protein n=1 Tax=Chara braunii TaxID=69332 RepID=A0A388KUE0_CHABU|nr:hypothetical protein CBR_g17027 [Chara braunii]|eukprot:GBG73685.1 hypothetical protein CBR_g17027 [Chara braunii]